MGWFERECIHEAHTLEHLFPNWYSECFEAPYVSLLMFPYLISLPFALIVNHFPLPLPWFSCFQLRQLPLLHKPAFAPRGTDRKTRWTHPRGGHLRLRKCAHLYKPVAKMRLGPTQEEPGPYRTEEKDDINPRSSRVRPEWGLILIFSVQIEKRSLYHLQTQLGEELGSRGRGNKWWSYSCHSTDCIVQVAGETCLCAVVLVMPRLAYQRLPPLGVAGTT